MSPIMGSCRDELAERPGSWLRIVRARNRQATAGASHRSEIPSAPLEFARPKSRRLNFGDGRRGCQERNWFSSRFISFSFIIFSFQAVFHFLQTVAISAGGRI